MLRNYFLKFYTLAAAFSVFFWILNFILEDSMEASMEDATGVIMQVISYVIIL